MPCTKQPLLGGVQRLRLRCRKVKRWYLLLQSVGTEGEIYRAGATGELNV